MPLVRYFFCVGAVLLTLLFVADAYLPKSPPEQRTTATADLSVIRIHSDRKWPERVVFDGVFPTVTPTPPRTITASVPSPTHVAEVSPKAVAPEVYAQLSSSNPDQVRPADSRKAEPKPQRKRRAIAKGYAAP